MRQIILFLVVIAAVVAMLWNRPAATAAIDAPLLSFVATAHQLGVVGYRDPAGVISPDGTRVAYAEGRMIRVMPIGGGALATLAPGDGQIRYLAWASNSIVVAEDATPAARWWSYRIDTGDRTPLWNPKDTADLRQLTWRADGRMAAAIVTTKDGPELVRLSADGSNAERTRLTGRVSSPAFLANATIACVIDARLSSPCGQPAVTFTPDVDVYGPIAASSDGGRVYFASPAGDGMVALWTADLHTRRARRVSSFARDAYAPSISSEGTVLFKVQSYRTVVADAAADGGVSRQLTTFQVETPSYHPARSLLSFTYGTWRRVLDDGKYPDIAQEIGTIDLANAVPASQPLEVIAKSESEDQAMTWSPNGKWIAFHSHREMSDDVWLRPAAGDRPDKRITFLGRGAEVGWPRWSPDGKNVLLDGAGKAGGRSVIYVIGIDDNSGATTADLREVRAEGFEGEITHAEWLGNANVIALAKEGPGRHAIITLPAGGGVPRFVHRFATEHDFSGLGVSPDGRYVAFAAPAADGFYQIFKKAIAGDAAPAQVTSDPSNKTQPAWSPDGTRIAFTVWSYDASFYAFRQPR